jgi:hypothetical protein
MSLQHDHVGLSNGSARQNWNVPQAQPPTERFAASGLVPTATPHTPPSQPTTTGRGIVS